VHGTCHRFGQDGGVQVEVVHRVALARRRHTYSAKPPGSVTLALGGGGKMPAPALAVIAQPAREHVVEGHHLTGRDLDYPLPRRSTSPTISCPGQGVYREELPVVQVDIGAAHPVTRTRRRTSPGPGRVGDLGQTEFAGLVVYDSVQGRLPVVVKPSGQDGRFQPAPVPGPAQSGRDLASGTGSSRSLSPGPGHRPGHAGPTEAVPD